MAEGIRAPNIPLGTSLSEFIGIETVGATKSVRRFTRDSVVGLIEAIANSFQAGGGVVFKTKAEADAHLAYNAYQMAWVIQDTSAALNGVYQKSGASGSGGWARVGNLPYSFYRAVNNGAGTANGIVATNSYPLASTDALIVVNITDANTSGTMTVSFNGGPAYPIKTASGNDPAVGGFVPGMVIAGYITPAAEFHLITDQSGAAIQAAAEAAQAAAEDARDLAIAAADQAAIEGAGDVPTYPSRTYAAAATIPTARTYLFLAGYATKGDGPLVMYVKMGSTPSPVKPWQFQSADGAYWELSMDYVTPEMFGAKGDGVVSSDASGFTVTGTDNADALQAWADYSALDKRVPPQVYATTKTVNLPVNSCLRGIEGKSCIAGKASGTWTSSAGSLGSVVNCGGQLIALPALAVSAARGARSFTFVSAPTISRHDVIVAWNPDSYSFTGQTLAAQGGWSNDRPWYRDGEMVEALDPSGSVVATLEALACTTFDTYDKDTMSMYRIPKASISIFGVAFQAPGPGEATMALNLSLLTNVRLSGVRVAGSGTQSLQTDRCYGIVADNMDVEGIAPNGTDQVYGWALSNCQNGDIQGRFRSTWHPIAIGGNDVTASCPNRGIVIRDSVMSSQASAGVPGSDSHGNSVGITWINCTIDNGVGMAGDGMSYIKCRIRGGGVNGGVVALISEVIGGEFLFRDCIFETNGDPTDGRGYIDLGGNSAAFTKNARRETTLRIRNCTLIAPGTTATTAAVKVASDGASASLNVDIRGFKGPAALTRVLQINGVNGTVPANNITVDDISGFADGALLVFDGGGMTSSTVTQWKLMNQSGRQNVTTASGSAAASHTLENFRYSYPFVPHIIVELDDDLFDPSNGPIVSRVYAKSNAAIQTGVRTYNRSAFTAAIPCVVAWHASVNGVQGPS
jgi:hypothetical protein